MSLKNFMMHTASVRAMTRTQDDYGHDKESLSSKGYDVKCRFVPMERSSKHEYGQIDIVEKYQVMFAADPRLTLDKMLVWNDKVWRIKAYVDSSHLGRVWLADVEHAPQMELTA